MLVTKTLFNSVISTKGARFMTMDISNFYLMTPLHQPEFIRMKLSNIPDKIINEYKLQNKQHQAEAFMLSLIAACRVYPNQG
jgi:hypothetical protein